MGYICPVCGEAEMKNWNGGILECPECEAMIDRDFLDEMYGEV